MNLDSRILLLPSILLLIGAVIGTSATNSVAADDAITVEGDKSKVSSDIKTDDKNDCKESGDGDNDVDCQDESTVHIGTADTTDGPTEGTGTLIVTKQVLCVTPPCLFQPDDFQITVTGNDPSLEFFPGSAQGVEVTIGPGAYAVTETDPIAGITHTISVDCSGTMNVGETKNCVISNTVPGT